MTDTQQATTATSRFTARPVEGAWEIIDSRYRIRENPDPWARPGEPARDTYTVEAMMHKHFYYHLAEVETLDQAIEFIERDNASRVFVTNTERVSACRWCHETLYDLFWQSARACNLCGPYIHNESNDYTPEDFDDRA